MPFIRYTEPNTYGGEDFNCASAVRVPNFAGITKGISFIKTNTHTKITDASPGYMFSLLNYCKVSKEVYQKQFLFCFLFLFFIYRPFRLSFPEFIFPGINLPSIIFF